MVPSKSKSWKLLETVLSHLKLNAQPKIFVLCCLLGTLKNRACTLIVIVNNGSVKFRDFFFNISDVNLLAKLKLATIITNIYEISYTCM